MLGIEGKSKREIRKIVWDYMEKNNIVSFPRPCYGRIPNFLNSNIACERMVELEEFKNANCIFCAPDYVLKRAREIVLEYEKKLAVATPHMREFLEIKGKNTEAVYIKGFKKFGKKLKTKVELIVQGSVAVDRLGNRIGKGKGYGDKEYWYLLENSLLNENAKVLTVVHDVQVFDELSIPFKEYDVKVDYILTPTKIINCKSD
ncbi:MAG: 5-formyltetrahydrofolate cyclo-ligase [Candidatus Thermoplasmatota archaeon]